jgi:diguanylate cyclase (GGDEF)-like protein/PAS domain S-box-containing protein
MSILLVALLNLGSAEANEKDFDFFKLFESHGAVMLLIEVDSGAIVRANDAAAAFYGYSKDVLETMTIQQINMLNPEEVAQERRAAAAEKRNYFIFPHRLADGTIRTVEVYSYPFRLGEVTMLYSIIHDITEEEASRLRLQQSLSRLTQAEKITGLGHWEFNLTTGMFTISEGAEIITGLAGKSWSADEIQAIILPEYRPMRNAALDGLIHRNEPYDIRFRIRRPADGQVVHIHSIAEYNPEKSTVFGTIHNITQQVEKAAMLRRQQNITIYSLLAFILILLMFIRLLSLNIRRRKAAENSLFREKERLRITLSSVGDGVITTDRQGRVELINQVAQNLTGWTEKEAADKAFQEIFPILSEYSRMPLEDPVKKVLSTGKIIGLANHTLLIAKDGREIAIADSAAPIKDNLGNTHGVVLVFRDVTEERAKLRKIQHLSFHDQLTGLYNRWFFDAELKRLDTSRNLPISIIIADVNGLKLTNDAFGHAAGDAILKKAAEVMMSQCRADDIIARIGGDEFVILLPRTGPKETEQIVKRIQGKARETDADPVILSISMGWAQKDHPDMDISEVFRQAENYMYRRKLFESQSMLGTIVHTIIRTLHETNKQEEQHSRRVSELSSEIGQAMGLKEEIINDLMNIGMLHDIGKIAVSETILNKRGSLTPEEWREIQRHPEVGYRILSSVNEMAEMAEYVLAHHERWDGKGYPRGLSQKEILLQARITAVADAYDAMTSERPYRKALSKKEALEELTKNAGTQFDPEIVKIFVDVVLSRDQTAE